MSKKFSSVKSTSFGILLLSVSFLILFLSIVYPWYSGSIHSTPELVARVLFGSIIPVFNLWIWLRTDYVVEDEILVARSGPMIFKVPVRQISVIRLNQNTIGGLWKPTTSWSCIQVEYNKHDSVYISPVKQDEFIAELQKINPQIEIKQN